MRIKKTNVTLACAGILVIFLAWLAFKNLAQWLVVSDPLPQSLDVIFTFAGDNHRINYSKELFSKYANARWLISYPSKKIAVHLKRDGFDTSRIEVVDTCKNTSGEARLIADRARQIARASAVSPARPLTIGLVSVPFHMRRVRMLVSRTKPDGMCRFYCLPVPNEKYGLTKSDYDSWWTNAQLRSSVWLEFEKFIYYFVKFR